MFVFLITNCLNTTQKHVEFDLKHAQNGCGLCDDEPSPKSRRNKRPVNIWTFSAFSQCCVNMLNYMDKPH